MVINGALFLETVSCFLKRLIACWTFLISRPQHRHLEKEIGNTLTFRSARQHNHGSTSSLPAVDQRSGRARRARFQTLVQAPFRRKTASLV